MKKNEIQAKKNHEVKVVFTYFEILDCDFTGVEINVDGKIYVNFDEDEIDECSCDSKEKKKADFVCNCNNEFTVFDNQSEEFIFPNKKTILDVIRSSSSYRLKRKRK